MWELTAGQLGMWYHERLHAESAICNVGEYLEIRGRLDVELFEAALRRVIGRADAFHIRIHDEDERAWQEIDSSGDWSLRVIDVSPEADPRAAAQEWMRTDMLRPFDLREGPVFAQALLKISSDLFFWYQSAHQAALDGTSFHIVASQVARTYTALLPGGGPSAGDSPRPVSALLESYRSYRRSAEFDRDREFWRDVLAGFPGRRGQAAAQPPRRYTEPVSSDDVVAMKKAAWRLGTNFGGLLVAAAAIYLHRVTGAEDVVVGFQVDWRAGKRERDTPGMAVTVLPIRLAVRGTATVASLTRDVTAAIVGALPHQRYLNDAFRGMVVNVMPFDCELSFGDCAAYVHNLANGPVDDLTISAYDRPTAHGTEISYDLNPDLYGPVSGKDVARRFGRILGWLTTASTSDLVGLIDGEMASCHSHLADYDYQGPAGLAREAGRRGSTDPAGTRRVAARAVRRPPRRRRPAHPGTEQHASLGHQPRVLHPDGRVAAGDSARDDLR